MSALALDLRRGPAPLLAVALLGLGGAAVLGDSAGCAGQWPDAVVSVRQVLGVIAPCVLAAGVWQGGNARRRGLDDTIAATALPAWRRAAGEGGAIALVGVAAFAVLLATRTASGGCTSGLGSGNAAAAIGASALALAAAAFAGLALGRRAALAMAAPLALFTGLVVTMVSGGWSPGSGWSMLLLPAVDENLGAHELTVRASAGQMVWFAGVAISGWLFASGRPRRLRLLRLAPAVAGLAALAAVSP